MPTLAPEVDFQVQAEAPVRPTNFGGLANLVGTVVEGVAESQKVDSTALDRELVRGLRRVRALHDQGRSQQAYALETRILGNYTSYGGDLGSTRIKTLVQGITGRDPDDFGNSPEEVALQETLKSEEYQAAWLATFATHPQASEDERRELALGHLSLKEGRAAVLEQAQFNWNAEGEAAFMSEIDDFINTLVGGTLVQGQEGGELSLQDVQQTNLIFQQFRNQINARRPANISNEEWSSIQDRLDQAQKTIEYMEKIVGPENVGAQSISDLQQAIRSADIPDVERNLMLRMISADPETLSTFALPPSRMAEIMRSLQLPENGGLTGSELRDSTITDPFPRENVAGMSSEELYNNMRNVNEGARYANGLTTNVEMREAWGQANTIAISNLNELAARGEWMTAEQYDNIFSDDFFEKLDSIKDVDPKLHAALSQRAQRALTTSGNAMQARLDSVTANSPLQFDTQSQTFTLTSEGLRRVVPPHVAKQIEEAAVREYGGDVDTALSLALRDQGGRFNGNELNSRWFTVQSMANNNREAMEQLGSGIYAVLGAQRRIATGSASDLIPGGAENTELRSSTDRPLPKSVMEDGAFFSAVAEVSGELNINPNHLLRAMDFETAGTFDPALNHPGSTATGLIGFLRSTARGLGYSLNDLKQMDRAEQTRGPVLQYLSQHLKGVENPTFGDIYMAIHYPAGAGKGDGYVMYRRGSPEYKANRGLDTNNDGTVTAGEAVSRAWAGSSGQSKMPSSIGESILEAGTRAEGDVSGGETSTPAPTATTTTTPEGAPAEVDDGTVVQQQQGGGDQQTASQKAAQQKMERILALFPDLSTEQVEELLQILEEDN